VKKITSIVLNNFTNDSRVLKENLSLQKAGYDVTVVALHEEGSDVILISNTLKIPQATVEMVLKFHHLNKSDNWRESVDNNL